MTLLVSVLWPGLAAALLLGACIGAITGLPRDRFGSIAAATPVALLAILSGLALLRTVPGQGGLWVESAAAMLAVYLTGCLTGGIGRMAAGRR